MYNYRGPQNFHQRPRGRGYRGQRSRSQYQGWHHEQLSVPDSAYSRDLSETAPKSTGARPRQSYQAQRAERAQRGTTNHQGQQREYSSSASVQFRDSHSGYTSHQLNANAQPFYSSQGHSKKGRGGYSSGAQEPKMEQAQIDAMPASYSVPEPSKRAGTPQEAKSVMYERSTKRQGQKGPNRTFRQRQQAKKPAEDAETHRGEGIAGSNIRE